MLPSDLLPGQYTMVRSFQVLGTQKSLDPQSLQLGRCELEPKNLHVSNFTRFFQHRWCLDHILRNKVTEITFYKLNRMLPPRPLLMDEKKFLCLAL